MYIVNKLYIHRYIIYKIDENQPIRSGELRHCPAEVKEMRTLKKNLL